MSTEIEQALAAARLAMAEAEGRLKVARAAANRVCFMTSIGRVTDEETAAGAEEDLVSELGALIEDLTELLEAHAY